ncbi:MAG TPA: hypothetical protein VJ785_02025 [Anaerolineales bacterium]|nr:hypothetical protein [Anaerolineales bacterium]
MNQNNFNPGIKRTAIRLLVIVCLSFQMLIVTPAGAVQLQKQDGLAAVSAVIGGCPLFPANNIWNTPIDNLTVHARSDQWVNTIGRNTGFHMDFGSGTWNGGPIGIPYNIVGSGVPKVSVSFDYDDESDPGPYPIPNNPLIEHGSDHYILIVDSSTCTLYELFDASYSGGQWHAGSGAIWNLNSNALRPDTWTSADAAGLPILAGLVRYDEILSGEINHAIRFTASNTNGYIWPARHLTSNNPNTPQIPPLGARFRLKSSFEISGYPPEMQVILTAMKKYGIILADNGSNWYVSGAPDPRWGNDMLHLLDDLTGNDFEAVDTSGLMIDYDSGATGFTISGHAGTGGVILSYTDLTARTVISEGNGNYSLPVSDNWSGTVTPSHPCYTFSPANLSYSSVAESQTGQNYTPTFNPAPVCANTVGVFRPTNGLLYLRNSNTSGFADIAINYGIPGDKPVVGDWDGDGDDTIGVYRNGSFYLRNSNTIGFADMVFPFGSPGDQPIAGDWDGDGDETIGVYRPSTGLFMLRNSNSAGPADTQFFLGNVGDVGIAGDWDGDDIDTTGVFRPSNGIIFLKNQNTTGFADIALNYGIPGDKPVVGDWDNDGDTTIGIYRNGRFYLRNSNTNGFANIVLDLGNPADMPIAGNWDGLPLSE